MGKQYKIAGLKVEMETFGRTEKQAQPYLCAFEGPADVVIDCSKTVKPQLEQSQFSLSDQEYADTGRAFYTQLMNHRGMLLHSSAVVVDGRAYLFSATSGTGKSTHVKLWLKQFGDRAVLLNDDKPALRLEDGVWYAYGTPWSGKHDLSSNLRAPVAGIALVERGQTNSISPLGGATAVFRILEQTLRPESAQGKTVLLDLVSELMNSVKVWRLRCNMEPEAAIVAYEAMSGVEKEK